MVKTTTAVRRSIAAYAEKLEQVIQVDKVVLFGSYAQGNAREESDIDVAIISDDLAGYDVHAKVHLLAERAVGCDTLLAPVGYTLRQYEHADRLSFLNEIKCTGKVVWERNKRRKRAPRKATARRK